MKYYVYFHQTERLASASFLVLMVARGSESSGGQTSSSKNIKRVKFFLGKSSQRFTRELSKRRRRFQQRPLNHGSSEWDAYACEGGLLNSKAYTGVDYILYVR